MLSQGSNIQFQQLSTILYKRRCTSENCWTFQNVVFSRLKGWSSTFQAFRWPMNWSKIFCGNEAKCRNQPFNSPLDERLNDSVKLLAEHVFLW